MLLPHSVTVHQWTNQRRHHPKPHHYPTKSISLVHCYEVRSTIMSDYNLICRKADINNLAWSISTLKQTVSQVSLEGYNFFSRDVDCDQLRGELQELHWHGLLQEQEDVNVLLRKITQKCQEKCRKYCPKKRRENQSIDPRDRRILMRRQNLKKSKTKSQPS